MLIKSLVYFDVPADSTDMQLGIKLFTSTLAHMRNSNVQSCWQYLQMAKMYAIYLYLKETQTPLQKVTNYWW